AAFSAGQDQTHLFLLRSSRGEKPALSVYTLPLPLEELRTLTLTLRSQVTDPEVEVAEAVAASRALCARLFPAEAQKALLGAKRLLISPDGPLWEVPFAALVTNAQGAPRYLGEQTAITYTPSLTLFAQSRLHPRPRRAGGGKPTALVVGDPLFDRDPTRVAVASTEADLGRGERAALFLDGKPPVPLPGTKAEPAATARLHRSAP